VTAPRVLIVDDNEVNIEMATYLLTKAGMQVASVLDGHSLLARVAAFAPDLVLMDIQMPGLDGLTLTQRLRSLPGMRTPVIVAFTAFAMKGDREKFLASGCDGYIAKPIDVTTFADQVRALLPQRN
jgi:CheY-like chemotaxis protein